jgi:hypothetical protein
MLVKITKYSINRKNRRIKGLTTLGYRRFPGYGKILAPA